MTVTLDPPLSSLIQQKVDAGLYPDAEAALREAVRLLDEHDRLQQFHAEFQIGLDKADRSEDEPFTDELFEEI